MSNRFDLPEIGEPLNIDSFSSKQKESLLWYYDQSPVSVIATDAQGIFGMFIIPSLFFILLIITSFLPSRLTDSENLLIAVIFIATIIIFPLSMIGIAYLSPQYRRTYIMTDKRILILTAKEEISYVPYEEITDVKLKLNPLLPRGKVSMPSKTVHTYNPCARKIKAHFHGRKEDCEKVYSIARAQITALQATVE